jgi:hypothetical protein
VGNIDRNPATEVVPLALVDVENVRPWPKTRLNASYNQRRRAAFLGRACGQRRSDLVLFGRKHRRADGLQIKIGKLRVRASELAEIDSWSCSDTGPWITSGFGKPMSGEALWRAG